MKIISCKKIKDVKKIFFPQIKDKRGSFRRLICSDSLKKINLNGEYKQISISNNKKKGTIRGFHYQKNPYDEVKIVHCIKGKLLDIALDLREKSNTKFQFVKNTLSENSKFVLYIPSGFAHAFQTLEDDTTLIYYISRPYNKDFQSGINYKSKKLKINWPIKKKILSLKDNKLQEIK